MEKQDEISRNLTRIAELLFDPDNWSVNQIQLDERHVLTPGWPEGGFQVER